MPLEKVYIGSQQIWPSEGGGTDIELPLEVPDGGTGQTSFAGDRVVTTNAGGTALTTPASGSPGQVMTSQGGGAPPLFTDLVGAIKHSGNVSVIDPADYVFLASDGATVQGLIGIATGSMRLDMPNAGGTISMRAEGSTRLTIGATAISAFLPITLNADPTNPLEAATKQYVDAQVSVAQSRYPSINAQTGTSYTLVLTDAGKLVTLDNAGAVTVTVPLNSTVAYAVGTRIDLAGLGVGLVTVAATGGVTINATPSLGLRARYSGATLTKLATNTWLLVGDLA